MSRLLSQSVLYTVANLASRATMLVALIILPLILGARDYGVIGLVVATAAFVNIVAPLEVSQGLARFYATSPPRDKAELASSAWWFTIAALTACALLAAALARPLSEALFGVPGLAGPFRIAILFWIANTIFLFLQNQFRWNFEVRAYAVFSTVFAIAMLVGAIGLATVMPSKLIGALSGWTIAASVIAIAAAYRLRTTLFAPPSRAALMRMLRFSGPLVPASVAILLTTYFSRIAIGDLLGLREVGLFTFASQIAAIPSFVILGVQSALTPYVMAHFEKAETPALLARLFELVALAGLAACMIVAVLIDDLLRLGGYAEFIGSGRIVLLVGPALLAQQLYVFAPGFAISRRTGLQAAVSIASGILVVSLNYLLIPRFGVEGAAMAMLLAALVFIIGWFAIADRFYPVPVRWVPLAIAGILLLAGASLQFLVPGPFGGVAAAAGIVAALALSRAVWWPAILAVRRDSKTA